MTRARKLAASLALATIFAAPALLTSCSARVGYSVHDDYYHDDHVWDRNEAGYYARWESDNHRHHQDYRKLSPADQKSYWDWRHNQH